MKATRKESKCRKLKRWAVSAGLTLTAGMLAGCGNSMKMTDYEEYVTLGQYKGIEYTPLSTEVTDAELQEQVDSFLQQLGTTEELTEGTVAQGDRINLDYIGYADGEAFEGGSTDGAGTELIIGSHSYIDDFENQLIGHEVGEEGIEVNVTFPDDYENIDGTLSDLAGKEATFVCTINSILKDVYPEELTNDLVAENTDYDTVNSFMDALRMDYETYKETQAENQMKADLITKAIENATFLSYPEEELATLTEQTIQSAKATADSYGIEYETYLSYLKDEDGNAYTEEAYAAAVEDYMKELLEEKMVICEIAKAEGVEVTEAEVEAYVEAECAANTSLSADTIYENYSKQDLAYAVLYDKVIEILIENAIAINE